MPTQTKIDHSKTKKIKGSAHDSLIKAFRAKVADYKGEDEIYVYYPKHQQGVKFSRVDFYNKWLWVADLTKEITVKPLGKRDGK